jgi:hypothetical protein
MGSLLGRTGCSSVTALGAVGKRGKGTSEAGFSLPLMEGRPAGGRS